MQLDNPIEVPDVLSFLTYKRWNAEGKGLKDLDRGSAYKNAKGLLAASTISSLV